MRVGIRIDAGHATDGKDERTSALNRYRPHFPQSRDEVRVSSVDHSQQALCNSERVLEDAEFAPRDVRFKTRGTSHRVPGDLNAGEMAEWLKAAVC